MVERGERQPRSLDDEQWHAYLALVHDLNLMVDGSGRMPLVHAAAQRVSRLYRNALKAQNNQRAWSAYHGAAITFLDRVPRDFSIGEAAAACARLTAFVHENRDLIAR